LHDFGFSIEEIAKHYGMSVRIISDIIIYRGAAPCLSHVAPHAKSIFDGWLSGVSRRQLAAKYGVSRDVILRTVRDYGSTFEPDVYWDRLKLVSLKPLKQENESDGI